MKRPRILLVDDALLSARMLARMLTEDGFDVDVADNGEQALEQLERRLPDLLITDIYMHGIDGLTVASDARTRDPDLPVIFITAYPQLAPRPVWRRASLHIKPFDYAALLADARRLHQLGSHALPEEAA